MPFKQIIAVYSEDHTKPTYKNARLTVKAVDAYSYN
jgi:hypothetical protein